MNYPFENPDENRTPGPSKHNVRAEEEAPPAAPTGSEPLQITFKSHRGIEQAFKIKKTTQITKAMDAFGAKLERPRDQLRFLLDGERLTAGTVGDCGLEDGDSIDVYEEQIGGGDGCCGGKCHCGDENCDGKCCSGKSGCRGGSEGK